MGVCLNLPIKIEQTTFPLRFNSLSNNLCEEVENNKKWTENQFIKYQQDLLGHINQCLKLLREKLVRSSVIHEVSSRRVILWMLAMSKGLESYISTFTATFTVLVTYFFHHQNRTPEACLLVLFATPQLCEPTFLSVLYLYQNNLKRILTNTDSWSQPGAETSDPLGASRQAPR